jgi:pullulanase/glycogen debranching enzyme
MCSNDSGYLNFAVVDLSAADHPAACLSAQVFSRHATAMSLCLMRADGSGYLEVSLDPITNKSGDVWHVQLSGLKVGSCVCILIDQMRRTCVQFI